MGDREEVEKHYWVGIESSVEFECSKGYRESMLRAWEAAKPNAAGKQFGQVLLFGTGGEVYRDDYQIY
jgi:hypothetical protein